LLIITINYSCKLIFTGLCFGLYTFPEIVYGKRVIELGCGPGLVGITCGLLGARDTYVTDGDPASVNLTQRNIQANNLSLDCCKAEKYLWYALYCIHLMQHNNTVVIRGDTMSPLVKEAPFDIILGADIVACPYASAFDALLEAFLTLSDTKTTILLAYKRRHGMESDFFSKMETFFTLIEVPRDQIHGDFKDSDIFLYKAKRKSSI
jgi:predicted nicotinamide N-methyase